MLCWQKWIDVRDREAGDQLIERYMPLVDYHVQRIASSLPKSVKKEDLKSLALFGLYDALEKFDPSRDLKFDTYASFRIRGAILDGLRKEDWLPRSVREKAKKIEATIEQLQQTYMRDVSAKEVAHALNMSEDEVYAVMSEQFFANVLSLDERPFDDDDQPSFTIRDDQSPSPEEHVLREERIAQLANVIQQLNGKEQLVISLFYKEELTFTEIGHIMGLSTSRISQIHAKALFKMRKLIEQAI
ncbi:FliA/WhiG family RNA polymerase sigma factor [Anoxybacillus flavithermus]|nr:FliA/WhiG family RNA polymerase sigma factor [Anoxybacillus flavithermus]MBE2942375.1 FliA/WhiG family RNA polymerase sigma factor [Anoxybacillus flavithermus]MBE2950610.1 FliA/WhiG family RNA polymerase sigma factor [Anoxybacillus flavithermus]MBE2953271.1 FliA/WhiG family RNA polymerase sigma factor [Anoxybacillus flavithermus]MBE2958585.1 FliA/WhiG family RNA polymerase sigma factor [Anoxybacillus flavithermus]